MIGPPPLRFLAIVVGGWACVRAALLVPDWAEEEMEPRAAAAAAPPSGSTAEVFESSSAAAPSPSAPLPLPFPKLKNKDALLPSLPRPVRPVLKPRAIPALAAAMPVRPPLALRPQPALPTAMDEGPSAIEPADLVRKSSLGRWSASAWAFLRRGDRPELAAGGTLGGSQLGGRIFYRLNHDPARALSLTARAYAPINRRQASEAAIGLEWRPLALPIRLLAERRQATGSEGRSAFALMAYGGVSELKVAGPITVDAYAQAGVVGARSRDLFADGSIALSVPVAKRVRVGAAAWGAAQPDVSRLDLGPQLSVRLPEAGANVRLSAEWRFRVAGDAEPRSGPALTLATDF